MKLRSVAIGLLLALSLAAEPPPTHLMYLSSDLELKLAVALKREYYPWPVMRVGVASWNNHEFGHIRFWVKDGAGRAHVLRQSRRAALLAFRLLPRMVVLDIDVAPSDDTSAVKAKPWFSATLRREQALSTSLSLPPQAWFEAQGPITLREKLHHEGDRAQSLAGALLYQWNTPLPKAPSRAPKPRP